MKVTRAQILAFLNDGAEESTKLRAGDVAFLVKRGNTIRPAPKHKPLALPCLIELPSSYGKDQRERLRWVCYDERGKLRLSDEKSDSLPLREPDAQDPDEGQEEKQPEEHGELQRVGPGKWKQSSKTRCNDEVVRDKADMRLAGIDPAELDSAETPEELRAFLQARGLSASEIQAAVDRLFSEKYTRYKITRVDAEVWLKKQGLSNDEQKLVLSYVFDDRRRRQLAVLVGKKKTWVSSKLKNPEIKRCIRELTAAVHQGRALIPMDAGKGAKGPNTLIFTNSDWPPGTPLHEWAELARSCLGTGRESPKVEPQYRRLFEGLLVGGPLTAENVVETIRKMPSWLLASDSHGLLGAFVDLLEAAYYGDCARRVAGVVKEASRRQVAFQARRHLARLLKPLRGSQYNFPMAPGATLEPLRHRISILQKAWGNLRDTAEGTPLGRLERFCEAHGEELLGLTKPELHNILTGDPLLAAANYAEKVTGLSAETYLTSYNKVYPPTH